MGSLSSIRKISRRTIHFTGLGTIDLLMALVVVKGCQISN